MPIPRNMTLVEARSGWLDLEQSEEETISIHEVIDAHPWDGCVAFMQAMKETYGWAQPDANPWIVVAQATRRPMISYRDWRQRNGDDLLGCLQCCRVSKLSWMTGTEDKRGQTQVLYRGAGQAQAHRG